MNAERATLAFPKSLNQTKSPRAGPKRGPEVAASLATRPSLFLRSS